MTKKDGGLSQNVCQTVEKMADWESFITTQAKRERLSKIKALAIFSSDALSSTAYATEEILIVLTAASMTLSIYSLPIALGIAALIFIVAFSYTQTVRPIPRGWLLHRGF